LINNAGIAINGDDFNEEIVNTTFAVNFFGTIELTEKLFPFLKDSGKVIIIGSSAGKLRILNSEDLKN
jgi:short-subunit dehydrogenase